MRDMSPMMPALAPILTVILAYINDQLTDITRQAWEKGYDYIIVGAGSAGAVLANRLTESQDTKVLLLEAGGRENFASEVPYAAATLQKTDIDWGYRTVPQKDACTAMKNRRSAWPRGKVLGGSSTINYMLYVRGNKRDYDRWADMGCTGWSWAEVFPYFLKSEDNRDEKYAKNGFHSTGGYLTVSSPAIQSPLTRAFLESGQHLGYKVGDYNGHTQAVFSYPQGTIRDGKRCSTAKAFLKPVASRPNLHIVTGAHVIKILFNPDTKEPEALGVRFKRKFVTHEVSAKREVILSAGAIGSPQLLMLSGVGPADHLKKHKIQVVADLPVGKNLQDHLFASITFKTRDGSSSRHSKAVTARSVLDFLVHNKGPLTSLGGVEGFGFIKTSYTDQQDDWPDYQIHMAPASGGTSGEVFHKAQDLTDEFVERFLMPYADVDSMSFFPAMLRPKSRGNIRLRSSNPMDEPLIDPKYYSHPDDLNSMVEAMKICLALGEAPPLKRYQAEPFKSVVPGCGKFELYSDEYLACMARAYTSTLYHPVGTCRMGPEDDPQTVVDPQLRVKGIKKLRVVDASIMPTIVSGNTNVPTIMIAERASDLIKGF